ncbi:MAG: asparagine synthase (glutamine-hydrolyzing) [Gemmatimonadetes bacterium]|nr:asparagine synthase (glutamine-hydrolyzing) [Gemmatimonadota bacterium]MDP7633765.1 asparagine synthase (glutamine-hydrolyzing) [Candidatus Latescibacterota bacterium]
MCGIAGVIRLHGPEVSEETITCMAHSIEHRGPDAIGLRIDEGGAMANCRLSIIDVEHGQQPAANEDQSVHVVFNGEIYNHTDLRRELEAERHQLASHSDTEVLPHLYEEHGEQMLARLNGMFAFALQDTRSHRWLLARDRLGIKPLFYAHVDDRIYFGSEIKAILSDGHFEVDEEAVELYLSLRYLPAPWTMFKGIRRLPPGKALIVEADGQIQEWAYWEPWRSPRSGDDVSVDVAADQIRELLSDSVRLRLMSDVPFGAFLSGGLDSSGVVALMAQHMDEPVQTFSIGFSEESRVDETTHARAVADHCGTRHREVDCTAERVDLLPKLLHHFDEPFADPIIVPTHQVSELARKHVKVVLTGEGADELFGGYTRYVRDRSIQRMRILPAPLRLALAAAGRQAAPGHSLTRAMAMSAQSAPGRALSWVSAFEDDELATVTSMSPTGAARRLYEQIAAESPAGNDLETLMFCEQRLRLPDCMLARTDRMTMAVSLEGRTPFLDHRLVEYVMWLPHRLKVNRGEEKVALKRALAPLLPDSTTQRRKQGLAVPFAQWARYGVETSIRRVLAPKAVEARGLLQPHAVAGLLDHWGAHASRQSQQVWSLLCLELWFRLNVDNVRLPADTPLSQVG